MVSSCQLKAARALLGWSAIELANVSGVGSATIKRYEVQVGIPSGNSKNLFKLIKSLESAGIEFTGDPLINPGVTIHFHKGRDND
jgi:DNA-binding transcriptional regulator YiaG